MDKKFLLSQTSVDAIDQIVKNHPIPASTFKEDGSPVTQLDLSLSEFIEKLCLRQFPNHTFYSEEKFSEWKFPLIALDPLDGTREYINGNPEWAISLGIFNKNEFVGEGWIYNPLTKEQFDHGKYLPFEKKSRYCGEVSRSEWESGFFKNFSSQKFSLSPMGSIAYKLGRLSHNKCDFVVSLRGKNIWDIGAGTLLCKEAGFKFYSQGKEVSEVKPFYEAPLIWCSEEIFSELSSLLT